MTERETAAQLLSAISDEYVRVQQRLEATPRWRWYRRWWMRGLLIELQTLRRHVKAYRFNELYGAQTSVYTTEDEDL